MEAKTKKDTKAINRLSFINLSTYNAPDASEVPTSSGKWIKYGADNDFFNYLLERYYGSPTNQACITGISEMVVGDGLTSPVAQKRPDAYAKAVVMFPLEDCKRWAFDLKAFGFLLMQVISEGDNVRAKHTPVENWRSGAANDKGEVDTWYFSNNWDKTREAKYKPEPYPAYKKGANAKVSILAVKPFRAGSFYYPAVDYYGGLPYAYLEEEVGIFHLSSVQNGLFPGLLINFNNGDPGDEERRLMEAKIRDKWGGTSNAGRFILSFNDNKEEAATVESAPISDLDKQYEFLSKESTNKVLLSHRVTSPLIFGIRGDGSGLGNNANELTEAYKLFSTTVLKQYRATITEAFESLLADQGYTIPLTFKDSAYFSPPVETSLSAEALDMSDEDGEQWLDYLKDKGEVLDPKDWELLLEEPVNPHADPVTLSDLEGVPEEKSEQDKGLYKIRYAYAPPRTQHNSRAFCVDMVNLSKSGTVYRKEDIIIMGHRGVNGELSPRGESTYNLFLYKGGVNCHHYWTRRVYFRKREAGKFLPPSKTEDLENEEAVNVTVARSRGVKITPNPAKVAIKPINMPRQGRKN